MKRNTGEDDGAAIAFSFLNLMPRALHDGALAITIGRTCAASAEYERTCWKIGGRDDFDKFVDGDVGIVDIGQACLDYFAQIMRRDVGRHADGNTARAIDQQVRETSGQNLRLFTAAVIIGLEINRVLIKIIQKRVGDLVQPRLGVAHRCWRIGVHRTEVALTIDQRHAHRPILSHTCQCVVNRAVAMRVIIAHHIADDLSRFAIGPPGDKAAFLAGEQNPAVNRL